jgi:hypothetical protein
MRDRLVLARSTKGKFKRRGVQHGFVAGGVLEAEDFNCSKGSGAFLESDSAEGLVRNPTQDHRGSRGHLT